MSMAGLQRDRPAACKFLGGFETGRPALIKNGAGDGALLRTTHLFPCDGWAGMQDPSFACRERGDRVARQNKVHQARLRREITSKGSVVRAFYARIVDHA